MPHSFLEHGVAGIVGEDVHVVGTGEEPEFQGHQEGVDLRRIGICLLHSLGNKRKSGTNRKIQSDFLKIFV
jgi:hypothetical protein